MGIIRVIVGGLILAFGLLAWLGTMWENIPTPINPPPPIPKIFDFEYVMELGVEAIIVGIGFGILMWGISSSRSPEK